MIAAAMPLRALIFDVDGTLADTERDGHRVAFNAAFAAAGLDWDWDVATYGRLLEVTGGKERIRHYLDAYRPDDAARHDLDAWIAALHQAKTRHYAAIVARGALPLRPGVARLIAEARGAGVRLAIATTTTPDNVTALLRHALHEDAPGWFDVIAAGDVVERKKPAPDVYHYALAQLGLAACQCVAFEDSAAGLRASLAAGLATVITRNAYTLAQEFTGALCVLECLGEPDLAAGHIAGALPRLPYVTLHDVERWLAQGRGARV